MDDPSRVDEELIERFEAAWKEGSVEISDFLPEPTGENYLGTLTELVIIDLEFRWKRDTAANKAASSFATPDAVEDYVSRYPRLNSPDLIEQLAEEEFTIRHRYGDKPSVESFARRFPAFQSRFDKLNSLQALVSEQRASDAVSNALPRIDNYLLVGEVGEGGMGSVYLAQQEHPIRRTVAVKVIRRGLDSKDIIARFEAERQALAMMDHQNIARVYDAGATEQGQPYFAMEFIDGSPITEYCSRNRLTVSDRLKVFNDVCSAVQHAHQKGVLHRDLKPSNVLITEQDGQPVAKVIDFGLAKAIDSAELLTDKTLLTHAGQVLGTLMYMSPEQAVTQERDIDTRADVYALGVILYELLTGGTPLDDNAIRELSVLAALELIRDHEPVRPSEKLSANNDTTERVAAERGDSLSALRQSLRGDLDWVVMRALERDRERRYDSASSLADDVRRFLSDEPVVARPPSASYRLQKFARKNRILVMSGLAMLLLLLAGIAATSWQAIRATRAEEQATKQQGIAIARAAEAGQRRIEADEARRSAEQAAIHAQDSLALLIDSFQSVSPDMGATKDMLAVDVLNFALANVQAQQQRDHTSQVRLLITIADSYRGLGDIQTAISTAKLAEELCLAHSETSSELFAETLSSLAFGYAYDNQLDLAIATMRQSLATIDRQSVNDRAIKAAARSTNLAALLNSGGQTDEAAELMQPAFAILKEQLPETDRLRLAATVAMAEIYQSQDELELAIELLEEASQTCEEIKGRSNSMTLRTLNRLAECYRIQGRYDEAMSTHQESLKRCLEVFSPDNRVSLSLRMNVGITCQEAGHTADAIGMFTPLADFYVRSRQWAAGSGVLTRLVDMQSQQIKDFDPTPLSLEFTEVELLNRATQLGCVNTYCAHLSQLAYCFCALDQWPQAVIFYARALEYRSKFLGDTAPLTQSTRPLLANAYFVVHRPRDAQRILEDHIRFANVEEDIQNLDSSFLQLATAFLWQEDAPAALRQLEAYAVAAPNSFGPDGSWYAKTIYASTLAATGKYEEAVKQIEEIRHDAQWTPDDWIGTYNSHRCQSIMALCSAHLEETSDTAPSAIEALDALKSQRETIPVSHRWCIVRACERIIEIYQVTGNTEQVQKWKVELEKLNSAE